MSRKKDVEKRLRDSEKNSRRVGKVLKKSNWEF